MTHEHRFVEEQRVTVRVVFFDVFGTLMPYKSIPRNIILSKRAHLAGLEISPARMQSALDALAARSQGFAMAGQLGSEDVPRDRAYWEMTFGNVLRTCGVEGDVRPYATAMCDSFLQTEDFYLDDEALPTLRGLKQRGLAVGVISNSPKGLALTLDKYGILPELIVAVGSQDVGFEKPDPRIVDYALKQTGVQARDSAYVGDEYMTDARAAQAAGMLGILLNRNGHRQVSDLPSIRRLSDLLSADSPLWSSH
jgi:FMN phosphatase YigB (HAD superfamily)